MSSDWHDGNVGGWFLRSLSYEPTHPLLSWATSGKSFPYIYQEKKTVLHTLKFIPALINKEVVLCCPAAHIYIIYNIFMRLLCCTHTGQSLRHGDIICLRGDTGTGKTLILTVSVFFIFFPSVLFRLILLALLIRYFPLF